MKYDYVKYLTLVSQVGLLMAIPIFLCVFGGIWLDKVLGTGVLFLVIGIFLGVAAGFRNMFVIILGSAETKKKKKKGR